MFTTPVQVQTQAGASAPAPVQDRSVQSGLSGIADIFQFLGQAQRSSGPDAFVVKENWETEGHQAAVEDAAQYKFLLETKGRSSADAYRSKVALERQSTMNATTADAYRKTWQDTYGTSQDVVDRQREEDATRANETVIRNLENEGRNLVMANAVPGVDINTVSQSDLVAIARVYQGTKAQISLDADRIAYASAQRNNMLGERKLKSEVGISAFIHQNSADISAKLVAVSAALSQGGQVAQAAKMDALAWIEQRRSLLASDATSYLNTNGGDLNDIGLDRLNLVVTQLDTVKDMITGKFGTDALEAQLKGLALSNTLNVLPRLPDKVSRIVYINHATRLNNGLTQNLLETSGIPLANEQYIEALRNLRMGAASAVQNTGVPQSDLHAGLIRAIETGGDEVAADAAEAIVNSLQETFQSAAGIRQKASSPDGVPALMAGLARMTQPSELFTASIQAAAARENTTPEEIWTRSVEGMFRETIAPSLQFKDPYVLTNIDLQYSNGKFVVKLNEEQYRKDANLGENISNLSGRDINKGKINTINNNLLRLQGVLNDSIKGYERVMKGNPDDVAAAIKAQLDIVMGVNKIYQGK